MRAGFRNRVFASKALSGAPKIAAVGAVLATAACTTTPERPLTAVTSEVGASQSAIALPPGQPTVIAVLERRYLNGVSQEIALTTSSSTSGQNAFYANAVTDPEMQSETDNLLKIRTPTLERVAAEMDERLSGIDMRPSPRTVSNKYGPFDYAVGRSDKGDLCFYAWQNIKREKPYFFRPNGATAIRLRLCDAKATEKQLLKTMEAYTIRSDFLPGGWKEEHPQAATFDVKAPSPAVATALDIQGHPAPVRKTAARAQPRPAPAPPATSSEKGGASEPESQSSLSGYPPVPPPPSE